MRRFLVLLLAAAALLLSGCETFPPPESDKDTILAIPVSFSIADKHYLESRDSVPAASGYYQIAIRRVGDGIFYRMVRIYAGSDVKLVTGIPPGQYYFDGYRFAHKRQTVLTAADDEPRGEGGPSGELETQFSLRGGEITVSPLHFHITMDRIGEERYDNRLSLDVRETAPGVREQLLKRSGAGKTSATGG